jgi:hypothetical protein
MADRPPRPERIEGPTPGGGAYAIAYTHDDGTVEVVEFDAAGREIRRTYSRPPARPGGARS